MSIFKKKETIIVKKYLEYAYKLEMYDTSGLCATSVVFSELSETSIQAVVSNPKLKEYPYTIIAYMLTGERLQNIVTISNKRVNNCTLLVLKESWVQLEERRGSPKVKTGLKAEFIVHKTAEDTHYPCKLRDISLTGVFIELSTALPLHTEGILKINEIDVTISIKLLRRQSDNSGYGCLFQNSLLASDTEQKVARYVYEQQRTMREQMRKYREES